MSLTYVLYLFLIGAISTYAAHRYFQIARNTASDLRTGAEAAVVLFSTSFCLAAVANFLGIAQWMK